ncbi:Daunorubicin/doxorubicin resistance ATP-binding protein DrrA [Planctomycetes bacterium Pla163]|uniref:Daunorubicin/doxorubicin resistance ATP-binding protein DrrA n=1 Tax=Rohdeia mirabilis TaxID=2528008 RepID=A0A518CY58_9BACT|nr:Daunorubicin/doxorubicin resistance ATP-binding protein DrrA [Planctomycetes bacterium Pla163]
MLEARGLRRTYGEVVALAGLDLRVEPGEVYALLGPNGAGKTTTVQLFLGFERPSAGTATIDGIDTAAEPLRARQRVAYVPDQVRLYPRFTAIENLAYLARLATGQRLERGAADALYDRVGLAREARDRRVGTFSKGMRQRVGIAAALAKGAGCLLLDEPTTGLDPRASNEFATLLRELADGQGLAILMATHDVFRSATSGDRIGVLVAGELALEVNGADVEPSELERLYLETVYAPPGTARP